MQIVGDTTVTREALFQVISRLRSNVFRESGSEGGRGGGGGAGGRELGHALPPSLSLAGESFSSSYDFGARMEPNSPAAGVFTLPGMSLAGAIHSSSGFGTLGTLGASPPEAWGLGGGGGLSSLSGFGGGPSHLIQPLAGGFGGRGGNRGVGSLGTSLGTMSTVEVHIPNTSVGSVIGKSGNNIAYIRQVSGAKVKLHNSEPGTNDRVLELLGTHEQTHAAQSLVQAYMQSSMGGGGMPFSTPGFAA